MSNESSGPNTLRRSYWLSARCAAVLLAAAAACGGAACAATPTAQAEDQAELAAWWQQYKRAFVRPDGRVARPSHDGDTVSEGQAYALLSAVFLDDRRMFESVWAWTRAHLSRSERFGDRLFAWRWQAGKVADWNSASDASLDIILALLLAHRRWGEESFKQEALAMAADVLEKETAPTRIGLTLLPGTWGKNGEEGHIINPSYFSPATFRMLLALTGDTRWGDLAATSYVVWTQSGRRMGRTRGVGLPPDWCTVTEHGHFGYARGKSGNYGWDALRIPMRAGLDALLAKDRRATRYLLTEPVRFFQNDLRHGRGHPAAKYASWGAAADPSESLAMSATALFAFQAAGARQPEALVTAFDRQRKSKCFAGSYYAQSMVLYPLAFRAGVFDRSW